MSAYGLGGVILGPWWKRWQDEEKPIRRAFCLAWGRVVIEPDELDEEKTTTKFKLAIGYAAKHKETRIRCICYRENLTKYLMRRLNRNDMAIVLGIWTDAVRKTAKGGKATSNILVSQIIPYTLIDFLYKFSENPQFKELIEQYDTEAPDVFEGDYE